MKLFRCKKGEKEVNNQRSNKLSKQPTGRKYSIYFWAAVSFCLIFYGTSSTSIEHFDENSLKNILNSIGQAIISGFNNEIRQKGETIGGRGCCSTRGYCFGG